VTSTLQTDAGLQAQLELAGQVQLRLLPDRRCCLSDWEVAFAYESAGFVSGDYVDLIPPLVLGKADRNGNVELVNAGHNPVLLLEGAEVEIIAAANLPLGMFCSTDLRASAKC
jgi:serine phosphatase RsbU (regulator of sigma subunit)